MRRQKFHKPSAVWYTYYRMPFDKLYLKVKCTTCKGTRIHNHGLHDPHHPHRWKRCAYCDHKGLIIIEATPDLIAAFIESTDDLTRQRLREKLVEIQTKK